MSSHFMSNQESSYLVVLARINSQATTSSWWRLTMKEMSRCLHRLVTSSSPWVNRFCTTRWQSYKQKVSLLVRDMLTQLASLETSLWSTAAETTTYTQISKISAWMTYTCMTSTKIPGSLFVSTIRCLVAGGAILCVRLTQAAMMITKVIIS